MQGWLLVRKASNFLTLRSISTSGSMSLEEGILSFTLQCGGGGDGGGGDGGGDGNWVGGTVGWLGGQCGGGDWVGRTVGWVKGLVGVS